METLIGLVVVVAVIAGVLWVVKNRNKDNDGTGQGGAGGGSTPDGNSQPK